MKTCLVYCVKRYVDETYAKEYQDLVHCEKVIYSTDEELVGYLRDNPAYAISECKPIMKDLRGYISDYSDGRRVYFTFKQLTEDPDRFVCVDQIGPQVTVLRGSSPEARILYDESTPFNVNIEVDAPGNTLWEDIEKAANEAFENREKDFRKWGKL